MNLSQNGTFANSATITGLSDTVDLYVGMACTGTQASYGSFTANTSSGSATITPGATATSNLIVGQTIIGSGIPAGSTVVSKNNGAGTAVLSHSASATATAVTMFAYMTVASIDSSSQIHLSGVISTSGTQTFTFWPLGITDPSFSTFVLPDLRGRYPTGADPTGAGGMPVNKPVLGAYIGEEQHTLTVAEMPAHQHGINLAAIGGLASGANYNLSGTAGVNVTSTGGGVAHNNIPPMLATTYIIKT